MLILRAWLFLSQMRLARQPMLQIGQRHLLQTQRQLILTQVKKHQVQMCKQLRLIRVLHLQIQIMRLQQLPQTVQQQLLQTVQQQLIRQIQKLVHVAVVPWQKLVKPIPTQRLVSNGLTANNTMSIVTVVCVRTSSLSKMGSHITLMLKQGLLRPSHRMNFQQNLSRQLWIFHLEISSTKTITNLWTNSTPSSLRMLGTVQRVFSRMVRLGQLQPRLTNVHS